MTPLQQALGLLRSGGVVAIPTETVYGLAADAQNEAAVARIFAIKGRPVDHPLIVHLATPAWASLWARELPGAFWRLSDRFWPGPLTMVVKRAPQVSDRITGGQDTVALRVPNHPLTLRLLRELGRPLVAPSANRFGRISPTTAEHVRLELGDRVDYILDGGACGVGLESTIVDLSGEHPRILRPGHLGLEQLAGLLPDLDGAQTGPAPRAPGTLDSHYAPGKPTYWLKEPAGAGRFGLLRHGPASFSAERDVCLPSDPESYARQLYDALRQLDSADVDVILVEPVPEGPAWAAIRDRLERATSGYWEPASSTNFPG